jgi:hypothetical protein
VPPIVGEARWDVPLRLLGGLHALVLTDEAEWERLDEALAHPRLPQLARRAVQTNEVQRSWTLAPCLREVARRIDAETVDLLELGASAGLNLLLDRYRHRYAAGSWGPADALLELEGEERRSVPAELLDVGLRVRRRVGVDRDPVDVTTDEGALRLRSFVWPGQEGRLERLDRAIAALRRDPPELVRADLADSLPHLLAARSREVPLLVFMTGVLGYLEQDAWERVQVALDAVGGRDAQLAFVWSGRPGDDVHTHWGLWLRLWPRAEPELLAEADYHGAWLAWRA